MFAGLQNVLGVAVALAVVAGTPPATAATRAAEFTLPGAADVDVCAYPSVATLADGRVICVYSGAQKKHAGKMALFAMYSADNGATWSPPQRLLDTPGQHDYDSSIIVIGSRMIVSSTTTPVHEKVIRESETWAVRSEDDGRSWSKPYQIPMGRRYTSGKTNNGIVLADGTALLGYTWENNLELGAESLAGEGEMDEVNAALISFDEGRTWTSSEGVALDERKAPRAIDAINGLCEPALVECDDGSVYMLCRTGLTQLYETRSTDGGRTWAEAEPAPFVSHNAPAALCKFTGSQSGVLAVWNNSPRDRWPLSVAASQDGCRTWTRPRDIALREGFESSYPCCTQTPDGQLLVVYQQQREGGRDIVGVKFPVEWLLESDSEATLASHMTAAAPNKTTVAGKEATPATEPPVEVGHFPVMPKPVITPDGQWLAYIIQHEGPGLEATPASQQVEVMASSDNGSTWSDPKPIIDLPSKEGGFGYFVPLADSDGEVHLFVMCDANTGAIRPRPADSGLTPVEPLANQRLDIWHVRSFEGRTRWSEPRRIWEGRGGDLQSATQLRSGRILLPVSYFVNRNWSNRGEGPDAFTFTGQFDTTVLYSDDGGDSWNTSPSVLRTATPDLASYGAIEPALLQLKDGRVWMLIRTQLGRFYESFSADGVEWSPLRPSTIKSSDSPAALARLADGRVLMVWNNCQRHPYAQGSRHVLHAAVSDDEGASWHGSREIVRDPLRDEPPPPGGDHGVSYPFVAAGPDGRLAMSLWVQTGAGRSLWRVDPRWLDATSATDDFEDGLAQWSSFGTRGVSIVTLPGDTGGHALQLEPAAPWGTSAVWNFPSARRGSVQLRMKASAGASPLSIQITDHFSPPFDDASALNSLAHARIDVDPTKADAARLPPDTWCDVAITWDVDDGAYQLTVDGDTVIAGRLQRYDAPPCYLRLSLENPSADVAGAVLVDRVTMEAVEN